MTDKTINFRLPGWVTPPGLSSGRSSPRPVLRNFRLAEPDPDSDVEKQAESSDGRRNRSNRNSREITTVRHWPLINTPYIAALPSPTEKDIAGKGDGLEKEHHDKKGKERRFSGIMRPHTHLHHPRQKKPQKKSDEPQV